MGLDITAYEKVGKRLDNDDMTDEERWAVYEDYEAEHWETWGSAETPEAVALYKMTGLPDRSGGQGEGIYLVGGRKVEFRAGSYSGYNRWREWLSQWATGLSSREVWKQRDKAQQPPFVELIAFSDCEGFIGPEVCRKLADDFKAHTPPGNPEDPEIRWMHEKYDSWYAAFDVASAEGVVYFH